MVIGRMSTAGQKLAISGIGRSVVDMRFLAILLHRATAITKSLSSPRKRTGVMKPILVITIGVIGSWIPAVAQEWDLGHRDTLMVSTAECDVAKCRVTIAVRNDQDLAGLDIPMRFGQPGAPIDLESVEWSDRVMNFDFKHAEIDNSSKTVILGLIAELGGTRPDPYLKPVSAQNPSIATLVFKVEGGNRPTFSTFTTDEPHHSLTFLFNGLEDSVLAVREITPVFKVETADE